MFAALDWAIVIAYLVFAFSVGIAMTRKAGQNIDSYFVAGRSLPWWWLGTSIVATTFAADTPLAVTGITANEGIAGNWLWWCWGLTYITVSVVFAARWRKSQVLTDVEFIELRYEGRSAKFLRLFKAGYFSLVLNCFILGWVFAAMSKITEPFVHWERILGSSTFQQLQAMWPNWLLFNDGFSTTMTILVVTVIVIAYSTLGGIRGVVLTDLFQFALAIITAVIFAWLAVDHVGGLESLYSQIDSQYGDRADHYTAFFPGLDNPLLPVQIFLIYLLVQWWARYDSDGTGYIAQRINTARTPGDARKGSLLFAILFLALRTWPWVMVALVALVVFPLEDPARHYEAGQLLIEEGSNDRESGYPALMKLILPTGLLGLTFTSLMAAFMSTVDTHLNWGSSYIVNDVYKRFLRPEAPNKELVLVSRGTVVLLSLIAILIASQLETIAGAWKFFWNMASGLGVAQLLRWLWWRANAWTEVAGMAAALVLTIIFSYTAPETNDTYLLLYIAVSSGGIAVLVTLLTPKVDEQTLRNFVQKVEPVGFWRDLKQTQGIGKSWYLTILTWLLAIVTAYSAMFAIGNFLKLQWAAGVGLVLLFAIGFYGLLKLMEKDI